MALQDDDAVFSSGEIIQGCGGSTSNAVDRIAGKGELIRVDGGFKKGQIMTVWDTWEEDVAREKELEKNLAAFIHMSPEVQRLLSALRRYGHHDTDCNIVCGSATCPEHGGCTCGLGPIVRGETV